jgi:anamorsin
MSPSVVIDSTSDFASPHKSILQPQRTLLLSPPSLSSHPEKLENVIEAYDRNATDMQMLDRLSLGLVSLPESTYDLILVLTDADGTRKESQNLLSRDVLALLVKTLKLAGRLRSQDGQLGSNPGQERNEAILAGLVYEEGKDFYKPDYGAQVSIPLGFGKKNGVAQAAGGLNGTNSDSVSLPLKGKRKSGNITNGAPAGVGFVDFSDDLGQPEAESDDELIDEDTLLDEEDLKRPVNIRKHPFYTR